MGRSAEIVSNVAQVVSNTTENTGVADVEENTFSNQFSCDEDRLQSQDITDPTTAEDDRSSLPVEIHTKSSTSPNTENAATNSLSVYSDCSITSLDGFSEEEQQVIDNLDQNNNEKS